MYLDVAVKDIRLVHVLNPTQSLVEVAEGLLLGEGAAATQHAEQVAVFGVLHDHVDFVLVGEHSPQLDNVRVV